MVDSFIPVRTLKNKIFDAKKLWTSKDFDLVVTNAQTNEDYHVGESIPKNTSVVIRRLPGPPLMPIVVESKPKVEDKVKKSETEKINLKAADPCTSIYPDEKELADLWGPEIPKASPLTSKEDENSKIRALVETTSLDWQRQHTHGFGPGRGFGCGRGGRMMARRGYDPAWFDRIVPPEGYVCYRCRQTGHLIQHCPTNGDPDYDIKMVKQPTGVPKSMLREITDGSYALRSGSVAVVEPNEAAFEKAIEGIPTLCRHIDHMPPELHCPLCKKVMKYAVLTSKCCFRSFCDKCIREYSITKSMCFCGAKNILAADDIVPNKTLRDTIERHLQSGISTAESDRSTFQVQDMGSASCSCPEIRSPCTSSASMGEQKPSPGNDKTPKLKEAPDEAKPVVSPQRVLEKERPTEVAADVSALKHKNRTERPSPAEHPRLTKRKPEYDHDPDYKHHERSQMRSHPQQQLIKKRKLSSIHRNATSDFRSASSMKVVHCR
ncbi:hypothetical protein FNV43_RR09018 [Rhamnella rubrinervis]|uniref:Uncharacterized protein n=1 Tax=Rhamnella rubrinervis TaxID=2594499 RepID=A0A8K0HAD6_9ROSA|nr:hypothetical protein FNV43_RR09018 [Rhamnella rubrinervis]